MLTPEDILINQFAQGQLSLEKLLEWFDKLEINAQREILVLTRAYLEQAHPDPETVQLGIESIPMKATMTPIVLLKTQAFKIALNRILELPDQELRKSFISLITLFKIADTQRRTTKCKDGCYHEWHNLEKYPTA
jgi:hypothetical protein